ncbi:thioesterase family protein [uncultured Psychrobacter sp.]|uniref:acyl-CoA thioesterase n=1 Tax=uncultured Psychrobacter sp. TaxID=259303 RepID=UPI00260CF117|nr:thioesterase family protein [uncultured Psychrobacter sp.]
MVAIAILPEIQDTLNKDEHHPMHSFAVIYSQQVEWGDMDSFGHVNNVVYYTYAQNARIHYNTQLNLFNENTFSVMAASSCQYFKPVIYPDTLWIGVRIKKVGNASVIHEYTYYSTAMNTIVASGESVLVYLDKATGQKKNIDETKKATITAFESLN